jgi:hypothetical protein
MTKKTLRNIKKKCIIQHISYQLERWSQQIYNSLLWASKSFRTSFPHYGKMIRNSTVNCSIYGTHKDDEIEVCAFVSHKNWAPWLLSCNHSLWLLIALHLTTSRLAVNFSKISLSIHATMNTSHIKNSIENFISLFKYKQIINVVYRFKKV